MSFSLSSYLAGHRKRINQYLTHILSLNDLSTELVQAMTHSLMAGGKRLRPILTIAAAQACKMDDTPALPAACAIEMIHTYSLIHDDLPAMDDDDLRRGQPTCHKKFSEATAVLAGDALLTQAFELLAEPWTVFDIYPDVQIRMALIAHIAKAAGTSGMVEGQMMDMLSDSAGISDPLTHLKTIHRLKTGEMIRVSVKAGALSVKADPVQTDHLLAYADCVGLAFQVADDILNVEGDPERLGKAVGSDAANDKTTFPAIIGLEASKKYAKELVDAAMDALQPLKTAAEPLRAIADYIVNRDR